MEKKSNMAFLYKLTKKSQLNCTFSTKIEFLLSKHQIFCFYLTGIVEFWWIFFHKKTIFKIKDKIKKLKRKFNKKLPQKITKLTSKKIYKNKNYKNKINKWKNIYL